MFPSDRSSPAVWCFSVGTTLWNLLWMGGGSLLLGWYIELPFVRVTGMVWCVIMTLPLAVRVPSI